MTNKNCLLGDDCDLTAAWMAGRMLGKRIAEIELAEWLARAEAAEAKLAKMATLVQAARDCADDLEDEVKWRLIGDHPFTIRARNEALEPVVRFRAALAAFDGDTVEQGGVAAGGMDAVAAALEKAAGIAMDIATRTRPHNMSDEASSAYFYAGRDIAEAIRALMQATDANNAALTEARK